LSVWSAWEPDLEPAVPDPVGRVSEDGQNGLLTRDRPVGGNRAESSRVRPRRLPRNM